MRIVIVTIGSHGDVQPYVALGRGLHAAGHSVLVATHHRFEPLVRERGLDFAPVAGDPRDFQSDPDLLALHDDSRNVLRWLRTFRRVEVPLLRQRLRDCWQACQGADVIVSSLLPFLLAYHVAQRLGAPLVRAYYYPVSPTRAYPAEYVPAGLRLGHSLNLATHLVTRHVLWHVARPWLARACRDVLRLPSLPVREPFGRLDRERQLLLYGYSSAVVPRPPDWGDWIQVTGYWFLDRHPQWRPPSDLVAFLNGGPPPVYVGGFGSMTRGNPVQLLRVVLNALAASGRRAVLLTGWGGMRGIPLPESVFAVDWVPFDWLFPRMAAVVHHGGAGTTAAGLRAGVPTVVVPFFLDNFFWGRHLHALGVAPAPIPRQRLSARRLSAVIQAATTDDGMRQRAQLVGERIRAEDGVATAVAVFERHLAAA
jgi:sterol 3beta-glucosyltransferase